MLRYLLLIVFFISCGICSYAQTKVLIYDSDSSYHYITIYRDTTIGAWKFIRSKNGYDFTAIPIDDSSKYFYKQYISLKNQGISDSINKYYFKLIKK